MVFACGRSSVCGHCSVVRQEVWCFLSSFGAGESCRQDCESQWLIMILRGRRQIGGGILVLLEPLGFVLLSTKMVVTICMSLGGKAVWPPLCPSQPACTFTE